MRMQRALGRAGGAGGVDHQRRIVRGGVARREVARRARQHVGKILGAIGSFIEREHEGEVRQLVADAGEARQPLRVGDQRLGAGIFQPIGQRIDAEQHRKRQRNGAELVDRDMGGRDLRALRQQDGDAVARADAVRCEHVGKPVRGLAQRAVAHLLDVAGVHVQDRNAPRIARGKRVADVDADVVARRHAPAELAIERVVVARGGKDGRRVIHGATLLQIGADWNCALTQSEAAPRSSLSPFTGRGLG